MISDTPNRSLAIPDPRHETIPQGLSLEVLAYSRQAADRDILSNDQRLAKGYVALLAGRGQEKKELQAAQLFIEARLGELFGPHPGEPPGVRDITNDNISPELRHAFRRLAWNPDGTSRVNQARRKIRDGIFARSALIIDLDGDYRKKEDNGSVPLLEIRHGDFTDVLADIPDDSVDLILTDPPYAVEHLELWTQLGAFAATKLKSGGSLIAYSGQSTLYEAHARLTEHLRYWWTCSITPGQSQRLPGKWVIVGWKPILWFVKDTLGQRSYVADKITGSGARKTEHEWAQGSDEVKGFIESLTEPHQFVVDPMAGSGSFGYAAVELGRQFIGADIEVVAAE